MEKTGEAIKKPVKSCGKKEVKKTAGTELPVHWPFRAGFLCGFREKGAAWDHSVRSATTGSFRAAMLEGMRPAIKVSSMEMPTRITPASGGSQAMLAMPVTE